MTIDLHDSYSGHVQGKRGLKFSYSVNSPITTNGPIETTTNDGSGTTKSTTTTTTASTDPSKGLTFSLEEGLLSEVRTNIHKLFVVKNINFKCYVFRDDFRPFVQYSLADCYKKWQKSVTVREYLVFLAVFFFPKFDKK